MSIMSCKVVYVNICMFSLLVVNLLRLLSNDKIFTQQQNECIKKFIFSLSLF